VRVLIDTQVLLWWFRDDPALSAKAQRTIANADNEVLVSAASGWEMAIKNKSGKLDAQELLDRLEMELTEEGFLVLPISLEHALRAGSLTLHHKDPFDRMLVAQAQAENLPILSNDAVFDRYTVRRIW
jgi:PIN domain nuclease of toxin-antitoxin system